MVVEIQSINLTWEFEVIGLLGNDNMSFTNHLALSIHFFLTEISKFCQMKLDYVFCLLSPMEYRLLVG